MNIITISREFGSGGRELGKRLSDILGYDYYDKEILSAIAESKGMNEDYVDSALDNEDWQSLPLTYHQSLLPYASNVKTELLLEQKKVVEGIAKRGRSCVIVGRNAGVLLREHRPFSIFVCADVNTKLRRCRERAEKGEELSDKELLQRMKSIDKGRMRTCEIIGGGKWGDSLFYDLCVNTSDWEIKELSHGIAELCLRYFNTRK